MSNEKKIEQLYLKNIVAEIKLKQTKNKSDIEELNDEFEELMHYYSSEHSHIDDTEKASVIQDVSEIKNVQYNLEKYGQRLVKQLNSPYFARMDFEDDYGKNAYYIGINSLTKQGNIIPLVCDWRAPISSMYYDFGVGKAFYNSPDGRIEGVINVKRQIKIDKSKLEYFFDSSQTISDEILQQVLSQNVTEKMTNIVATIQKEQNQIIREEQNKSLLVQGVAGSGKTSVALHRIAYLLYQNRQNLKSDEILILSPNHIFSAYISNVLPELGEENLMQITFDEIAKDELFEYVGPLQTRAEMIEQLLNNSTSTIKQIEKEISYKNSIAFYEKFKKYIENYFDLEFSAEDIKLGELTIKKETINDLYKNKYKNKIPAIRIDWIADYIADLLGFSSSNESVFVRIKKLLYPMFTKIKIEDIYSDFLATENMKFEKFDNKIKYEDIAPILYIKNYLLAVDKKQEIKYLIVDEMQDYSPIFFDVLCQMFNCSKTILGDIYQCVEKTIEQGYLDKLKIIVNAKVIELKTCYRSSKQIIDFAKKLMPQVEFTPFERLGEKVECYDLKTYEEKLAYIETKVSENQKYNKIAIITRTEKEAKKLYNGLQDINDISFITSGSQDQTKVMIIPVGLSKGLEFDVVISIDMQKRKNKLDKQLLYIASTRALHKLICIN